MSARDQGENSAVDVDVRVNLLDMRLKAHGYVTKTVPGALVVRNASTRGCCEGQRNPSDRITCRPYEGDNGRYWFFTSWQQPIAEADRIADAVAVIKGYLGPPEHRPRTDGAPEQNSKGRGGSGMTSPISEYPRKCLGKVAEVNGMTADGPWIAVRDAFGITGVGSGVLARWEEAGVISVLQNREGAPRLYLRPELEEVAKLGTGAPPSLRAVRRYVASRVGGDGRVERAADAGTGPGGVPGPETSGGAALVNTLANLLRGQRFTTEIVGEERVRVTKGADSRGVEIECRRRASDGDRWWFSWGGGVWMCEAENLADAVVQVKSALRTVRSAR